MSALRTIRAVRFTSLRKIPSCVKIAAHVACARAVMIAAPVVTVKRAVMTPTAMPPRA